MKRVVITGCAGFIGSHVVEEFLSSGYEVFGIDNLTYAGNDDNMSSFFLDPNFTFYKEDINNTLGVKWIVKNNNIEWIINLAAETHVDNSIKDDFEFIRTNILGTRSLLKVCKDNGIKILHFSTDEVYGSTHNKSFIEENKLNPTNPYSASKASTEHLIISYANTYGINYLMVRPSNNFGPRQHDEKFLPTILRKLKSGETIPVYGNGKQEREWTYVKDTAKATRFILEHSSLNEIYNISSGFYLKNVDLVKKVCDNVGVDYKDRIEFVKDRPGHDFKYSINSNKLKSLGFTMNDNFENNLKEMLNIEIHDGAKR